MVAAPWQPLLRITHAALPVKAANRTLPSTPSARCLASVVLPVPAYPKRRKIEARPRAALSQCEAAVRAASWWGVKIGIGGQDGGPPSIRTEREHLSRHGSAARTPRSTHAHDCGASREEESYRRRRGERCAQGR